MKWRMMGAWAMALGMGAAATAQQTVVWDVQNLSGGPNYMTNVQVEGSSTVNSEPSLQLRFAGLWAQFGQTFSTPVNWTSFSGFSITVQNLENREVSFGLRFDRNASYSNYVASSFVLQPLETKRFFLDLSGFDWGQYGLMCPPPVLNGMYTPFYPWQPGVPLDTVYRWQIYSRDGSPSRAKVTSLYGQTCNYSIIDLVDRFGQFARKSWDGKVTTVQDLQAQRQDEDAELAQNPGGSEIQGSLALTGTATGKWRLTKTVNGKYYFVSPQGKFFWSLGVASVNRKSDTIVTGRPAMFKNLPTTGDPRTAFYDTIVRNGQTKQTYSHYNANLSEKYGESWPSDWVSTTVRRMKSWGMNTLGHSAEMGVIAQSQMPYIKYIETNDFAVRLSTPSAYWLPVPDPFASNFSAYLGTKFASSLQFCKNDPKLIGVFVDTEHVWGLRDGGLRGRYEIPLASLKSASTQPAKVAFANRLQTKYTTIQALNSQWGTSFASWAELRANPFFPSDQQVQNMAVDLSAFALDFAKAYYWRVKVALKQVAPNLLYLGSKDVYGWCPDEYFQAQASYVDVISIDHYSDVDHTPWQAFASLGRPVLIAEFSFSARSGNGFANLNFPNCERIDQASRAAAAQDYLEHAATLKNVVGVHWFRYADYPIAGSADHDENFAFGMIDVTDKPYQEMVDMFRNFSATLYARRGR